ncbi:GNAT family N-acetyltransferase [Clostridium frigidicarnis]|uniref:Acetyltransferase (GNAT) domain-containing protein n=1 Tax=Clostridium frigidicarnis TaxID=84698 RepID=A0A1I0XNY3_9CLOT|nr:GNAT family N-acetyltransferase [Clostridium frigidicarnis]SFB02000.1 Acetyltransferase (GNAT) domain-containing protein [Clostridium frigidicarnis]
MIKYVNSLENIDDNNLKGFFVGWPNPPSSKKHMELLKNSDFFWLAIDDTNNNVVGFITAISDNVLSAYIPLLEVIPDYQGNGIGSQLVTRMLNSLSHLYMVDLVCDEPLTNFYKQFDMFKSQGMIIRNFHSQNGV